MVWRDGARWPADSDTLAEPAADSDAVSSVGADTRRLQYRSELLDVDASGDAWRQAGDVPSVGIVPDLLFGGHVRCAGRGAEAV